MFHLMNSLRDEDVIRRVIRLDPSKLVVPEDEPIRKGAARLRNQTDPNANRPQIQVPNVIFLLPPREIFAHIAEQRRQAEEAEQARVSAEKAASLLEEKRPAKGAEAIAFAQEHGIGRHEPCPCGSGQKFKKCCGASA